MAQTSIYPPVISFDDDFYLSKEFTSSLMLGNEGEYDEDGFKYSLFKIGNHTTRYVDFKELSDLDINLSKSTIKNISIDYSLISENLPHLLLAKLMLSGEYTNFRKYIEYYIGHGFLIDKIHSYAKSHALLEMSFKLLNSNQCTIKELYSILKSEEFTNISFQVTSIKYFYQFMKRAKDHKGRLDVFVMHGLLGKTSNREKVNEKVKRLITYFSRHANKISAREICNTLNWYLIMTPHINGGKKVAISTVQKVIRTPEVKNLRKLNTSEDNYSLDRLLPYILLDNAKNSCDRFEMDFTKLQVAAKDDKNAVRYYVVCYIIDTYSKKIISSGLDVSENSTLALNVFKKAVEAIGNKLPAEVVIDKSSAYKGFFKHVLEYTGKLGVIWTKSSNPRRKSNVERLISTIQSVYLNPVFGYIGEGIKSKRENARISSDSVVYLNDPDYVRDLRKLDYLMDDIVRSYNKNSIKENHESPGELFSQSKKINAIKLLEHQFPLMFWHKHSVKVDSSIARIQHDNIERAYITYDVDICLESNGEKLDFYISPSYDKVAYCFKFNTTTFIGTFQLHTRVHCARINQTKADKKKFSEHFTKKDELKTNLIKKMSEVDNGIKKDLGDLPIEIASYRTASKDFLNNKEFENALGIDSKPLKKIDVFDIKNKFKIKPEKVKSDNQIISSSFLKVSGTGKNLK